MTCLYLLVNMVDLRSIGSLSRSHLVCLTPGWKCFCRWRLAQRQEWGDKLRPCLVPAANARAGSPPSGVSTLPQRKRQKLIPLSTRSVRFFILIHRLKLFYHQQNCFALYVVIYPPRSCLSHDHSTYFFLLQVFADGEKPAKKSVDGIYTDPAKERTVRRIHYFLCFSA